MKIEFIHQQKQKKLFITGSTGFIGFALTKRLIELGFKNMYCLYRNDAKKDRMFNNIDISSITFLKGNITQPEILNNGIKDAAIVVNTVGLADEWGVKKEFWEINVSSIKTIADIITDLYQTTHFIHISSSGIYGFGDYDKTEKSPLVKSDEFYTASKIDGHHYLREQIKNGLKFPITIITPAIVWGPGDQIYVPVLKKKLKQKMLCYIGRDANINFIHINDLINGILATFYNTKAYNQEYIFDGPKPFTWKDYFETVAEYSNLPKPKLKIPFYFAITLAGFVEIITKLINVILPKFRPFITKIQVIILSKSLRLNSKKATEELGYNPEIDLEKGKQSWGEYIASVT